MKLLIIKFKLAYYSFLTNVEELINSLSGKKEELDFDRPLTQLSRHRKNEKLTRGIKKLTARLYGADGKLQRWAKRKDINIFNVIPGPKKTPLEKLEEARIIQRNLENPTDTSKTNESMVNHNVNNAPRYVLERERRTLSKEKFAAIKANDSVTAKILHRQIEVLNKQIRGMK